VDAFETALAGRVPEGTLLSHDLFEGLFARVGLVTDIELFEEFPARYEVAASRQHRWARGDWQLLPWLLRGTAGTGATRARISPIGRWKMLDNLRRTLSAPCAFLTLLVAWLLPGGAPGVWTKLVLLSLALPALVPVTTDIVPKRPGISSASYRSIVSVRFRRAHRLASPPLFQAWLMGDASADPVVSGHAPAARMVSAGKVVSSSLDLAQVYGRMWGAVALAVIAGVVAAWGTGQVWYIAFPLVALWLLSPGLARWVSLPPPARAAEELRREELDVLRSVARRSWRFFEVFVGPEDHALPPDNFQRIPSGGGPDFPTNVGRACFGGVRARSRLDRDARSTGQLSHPGDDGAK
jgi:cyclic beta-1,2-glucan synthetase